VVQGLQIGAWSIVGAGAVVIDDVEANTTVAGCPARVIASRPAGWQG
jgi:acetyltransferase-like isoleucine patch superfamily enzyme